MMTTDPDSPELEPLTVAADCEYCAIDECEDFEAIGYLRGRAICARCLARLNENSKAD